MSESTAHSAGRLTPHLLWVANNVMFMVFGLSAFRAYGESPVLGAAIGLIVGWLTAIYWTARDIHKSLCDSNQEGVAK